MAMLSIFGQSSIAKGNVNSITFTQSDLSSLAAISADSFYNTASNWKIVTFTYLDGVASKKLAFHSSDSFAALSKTFDKVGTWKLYSITIVDINDGLVVLKNGDLPSNPDFTVV